MTTQEQVPESLAEQLTTQLHRRRILQLGQEVDDAIANRICAQLVLLSAEDPRRDILLNINSPGGSVSAGLAIYDTMRLIPNDVSTLAMGTRPAWASSCCRRARRESGTRCRTPGS